MKPNVKLERLLLDLIEVQDEITHMQGKGPEFADDAQRLIQKRWDKRWEIVEHVIALEEQIEELEAMLGGLFVYIDSLEGVVNALILAEDTGDIALVNKACDLAREVMERIEEE